MIGQTLGNYRIVEQIGLGGMATVYKAYDASMDRYVALKVLPDRYSADSTFLKRFEREAKAIAKLEHPNILPVYAYGEDAGIPFLVMRYLPTGTLRERLLGGPLALRDAAALLRQVAMALDHAHQAGILHRDVKPSNVLLDAASNAYLTDFGIAKIVEATMDLTGGGILGTPAYMSPEQCRGGATLTAASDQYSLGIVLYEMITGRTPFIAETPLAIVYMHLHDPLPLPSMLRAELSPEVEAVMLKALTREPEHRYPSCGAFADAFAQAVNREEQEATRHVKESTTPSRAFKEPTFIEGTEPDMVVAAVPEPRLDRVIERDQRRGLPVAVWLVMALVTLGAVAAAVIAGLGGFDRIAPAEAAQGQIDHDLEPITPQKPAAQLWAIPCAWEGSLGGPGLCIDDELGDTRRVIDDRLGVIADRGSWSPDGRRIVFSAGPSEDSTEFALYIINADGSELQELPHIGNDISPEWSPDGQWIAFHSNGGLAIIHPDGSGLQRLRLGPECYERMAWSPDSRWIAAVVQVAGCQYELPRETQIQLIQVDGTQGPVIASFTQDREECVINNVAFNPNGDMVAGIDTNCDPWITPVDGDGPLRPLTEFPHWWNSFAYPLWAEGDSLRVSDIPEPVEAGEPSLIGRPVAGARLLAGCPGDDTALCIRDFAREDMWMGTFRPENLELDPWHASWSPDGTQAVVAGHLRNTTEHNRLYIVNTETGTMSTIIQRCNDVLPSWSPNGDWIAYHSCGELVVIHPDGRGMRVISDRQLHSNVEWSPDGQWIVASRLLEGDNENGPREIAMYPFEGGDPRSLAMIEHGPHPDQRVAFSPDMRYVAYIGVDGQAFLVNVENPAETIPVDEFPTWWTSTVFPRSY